MKEIILYGAGGHCYAAVALIQSLGQYDVKAIYDDQPKQSSIFGVSVKKYLGEDLAGKAVCITIGTNKIRRIISENFEAKYPSFIHNSAFIYKSSNIGLGTLVLPNAVIDADVQIGNFCIINNNATVSHNVRVGDFCHIAINAAIAGGVTIGEGTLIGAGSVVLPEISIGKNVTIGAGAVITKDIPDFVTVYGNPGKIINLNNQ